MLGRDYIMRQVTQFVQALLHILGLTQGQQHQAALDAIGALFRDLLGMDLDAVLDMPESVLLDFLHFHGTTHEGEQYAWIAITLLGEAGTAYAAQGREDESYACMLKALHLQLLLLQTRATVDRPAYAPHVDELALKLEDYVLPIHTYVGLFRYYAQKGALAEADDVLFEMIELQPEYPGLIEMGIAFYEHLLTLSDDALIAGDLPREEVQAGLAELQDYVQGQ